MADATTLRSFTVLRRDGSANTFRLPAPGAFSLLVRADPLRATFLLSELSTREIWLLAYASRELIVRFRHEVVPPGLDWWGTILGPEPEPELPDGLLDDY